MFGSMSLSVLQPSRTTVMIKPVGALCNLDCSYCYYLPTKTLYDGREHRMTLATLRAVFAGALPHFSDHVTIAWQGGEPTLAGLDFFRKAIEYQKQYQRPGQTVSHGLQTNGTLLDDDWCKFLREQNFLIGLSVDGPARFHNHYRKDNRGRDTFDAVKRGLDLLRKHQVEHNILCVINDHNVHHPDELMGYLINLGVKWIQFIPAIEWEADPARPGENRLAAYSPDPLAHGRFLCRVFDRWFDKYRGDISIREFDAVLHKLVLGVMPYCILDGSCHTQLTIEHDGSIFGCDHFVERRWQLAHVNDVTWHNPIRLDGSQHVGLTVHGGGIVKSQAHLGRDIEGMKDVPVSDETQDELVRATETPGPSRLDSTWFERVDGARLRSFAQRKQNLPDQCKACQWKAYCHGGCPKHRAHGGDLAEPTVLCPSYMMWFEHAMPRLQWLAGFLQRGSQPPGVEQVEQLPAHLRPPRSPAGPADATRTKRASASSAKRPLGSASGRIAALSARGTVAPSLRSPSSPSSRQHQPPSHPSAVR